MSQTYRVRTPIHGLRRADPLRAREPIGPDEVIALPEEIATPLLNVAAIERSTEAETCVLDFSASPLPATIPADDVDALIAAVRALGGAARIVRGADATELAAFEVEIAAHPDHVPRAPDASALASDVLLGEVIARLEDGAIAEKDLPPGLRRGEAEFARLRAGMVDAGAVSAEAAPDADPVGVALEALAARSNEIARLQKEFAARDASPSPKALKRASARAGQQTA